MLDYFASDITYTVCDVDYNLLNGVFISYGMGYTLCSLNFFTDC